METIFQSVNTVDIGQKPNISQIDSLFKRIRIGVLIAAGATKSCLICNETAGSELTRKAFKSESCETLKSYKNVRDPLMKKCSFI